MPKTPQVDPPWKYALAPFATWQYTESQELDELERLQSRCRGCGDDLRTEELAEGYCERCRTLLEHESDLEGIPTPEEGD